MDGTARCPMDDTPLGELDNGDLHCPECNRDWYWTDFDGERTLASRIRRVKLVKPIEVGECLDDCIKPIE